MSNIGLPVDAVSWPVLEKSVSNYIQGWTERSLLSSWAF